MLDGAADAPTVGLWEMAGSGEDGGPAPDEPVDQAAEIHADPVVDAWRDVEAQPDIDAEPSVEFETQAIPFEATGLPAGDTELDLGRALLDAGDPDEAAVRLGIALRIVPAMAPAVLDLVVGRTERSLVLVRGDAYRLVGREIEAQRAYAEAARGMASPPPPAADAALSDPTDHPTDHPSEGDPA